MKPSLRYGTKARESRHDVVMDDNITPLRIGGRDLAEWLTAERSQLVGSALRALVARIPGYAQLPVEELSGDIHRVTHHNLGLFITAVRTGSLPGEQELAHIRESAARRAEEGIPIEMVMTGYHVGVQAIWETIAPEAQPEDLADMIRVNALVLRYLERVSPAVAAGYVEERQTITGDEQSARQVLVTALLEGRPADEAAELAGVRLPEQYLVLAISIDPHPDELSEAVDATVAARRKLRRVRAELERSAQQPMLATLTPVGGMALVPGTAEGPSDAEWSWVTATTAALIRVAGADVTVGVSAAAPAAVAAAATLAAEVRDIARVVGNGPGAYRLEDVLLEYQMARPGAAREKLAGVLAPIAGRPDLLHTLSTFLLLGGRRSTAAELHVHPNTVDYRIRRIHSLTGLDPTRPADIPLLRGALAAQRLSARAG